MPANTRHSKARDVAMPYRYAADGLDFGIGGFSFDGDESGNPDYDDRTLPLYKFGEWDEVTIEANLTVNGDVDSVFPDDEGPPYPAKVVVVVDAEETQTRFEKIVDESPTRSGTYETEISLERPLLRGSVVLKPRLVRTEACRTGLPYAPNASMRVAGGESWELQVDEPDEDAEGFPFVYRDFSQEGMPPADLVHSISKSPNPKMMVNNQNEGVVDVLQSGNTYGFRPNLKRAMKADFGLLLWIQLVVQTATTIAESGDTEFQWQEGVVEQMAESDLGGHLFDTDADYQTIVDQLGEKVSEPAELRSFITDLCEAVQLYNDYAKHLDYFVDEEAP